jgi:hypothetical protein
MGTHHARPLLDFAAVARPVVVHHPRWPLGLHHLGAFVGGSSPPSQARTRSDTSRIHPPPIKRSTAAPSLMRSRTLYPFAFSSQPRREDAGARPARCKLDGVARNLRESSVRKRDPAQRFSQTTGDY